MITEAIVLAGGLGTRLKAVVTDLPKSLAPVAGRPFLAYLLDHAKKQLVMGAHARSPDCRRADQTPVAAGAVLFADDLFGADLAAAIQRIGGVVGIAVRDVADVTHELRRRPDRPLDRRREANGGDQVLHAVDVGDVTRQSGFLIKVGARGQVNERVRRKFPNGLREPCRVEDVAQIARCRPGFLVKTGDFPTRSLQSPHQRLANKTRAAGYQYLHR